MLRELKTKNSFSLLEVMISLMIISMSVVTLSGVEGVAIKSNRRTVVYTKASILANSLMAELELKTREFGFQYLDSLEKLKETTLKSSGYNNWKWKREIKEISFPIGNIVQEFADMQNKDQESTGKQMDMGAMNVMMSNLEQLMTEAMRQIIITVSWPLKAGKAYGHMKLIYYPVDFSVVEQYVPSF